MNAIPLILVAGSGLFGFYALYASERYRADVIRALAIRSGMRYLGNALPKSLTLEGTPFYRFSKVWNMIDGEPRGSRIMAFDCQVGVGKRSWMCTVIAVESDAEVVGHQTVASDMTICRSGQWNILYRSKTHFNLRIAGLTPVEELEAILNAVVASTA